MPLALDPDMESDFLPFGNSGSKFSKKWNRNNSSIKLEEWILRQHVRMNSLSKAGTNIMIFASERQQMNNVLPVRGHSTGKSCNARLPHSTYVLPLWFAAIHRGRRW